MKSNDKKLTAIRIIIFTLLAYIPVYLLTILGTDKDASFKTMFGALSIMWYPAIANVLTRVITKEGFEESFLHINIKGNKKYYVFAIAVPIIIAVVGSFSEVMFNMEGYDLSVGVNAFGGGLAVAATIMSLFVACISQLDRGFGEEFGWRAYLTPKLEKLMPAPLAITLTGIIWGLWHAPLVARGYNFGKEVSPVAAVVMMCVSCVVLSFILSWLTKRTGSVYPAAIFHIVYDAFNSTVFALVCLGIKDYENNYNEFRSAVMFMTVIPLVIAIPAAIGTIRTQKETPAQ